MKIRTGFVSNSSSSSFIIGYGLIKDRDHFNSIMSKISAMPDFRDYWVDVYDADELYKIPDRALYVSGGNDTEMRIHKEYFNSRKNHGLVILQILNDEGDDAFRGLNYDEDYELDYTKAHDIEYYSESQRALYELLKNEKVVTNSTVIFGAERNG